jgi:hypothetical protein
LQFFIQSFATSSLSLPTSVRQCYQNIAMNLLLSRMLDVWLETTVKKSACVCVCVCVYSCARAFNQQDPEKTLFLCSEVQIVMAWEVHHLKV